ncbi:hypothetical protein, variant [Fonticula alba]|uniref:Exonuclease domain-containing protein n=1 Tax=Fonticula alba TaxID=691883 RepID=A0A058Z907_FONAL|nr:hypothetical protein, variant [Fonticula alba]KCV70576.1 hypothetical protein, variant [Fonticula alba]|eukprot:XP_009495092.1 hypothetical protein, variant [Fonticula alba]
MNAMFTSPEGSSPAVMPLPANPLSEYITEAKVAVVNSLHQSLLTSFDDPARLAAWKERSVTLIDILQASGPNALSPEVDWAVFGSIADAEPHYAARRIAQLVELCNYHIVFGGFRSQGTVPARQAMDLLRLYYTLCAGALFDAAAPLDTAKANHPQALTFPTSYLSPPEMAGSSFGAAYTTIMHNGPLFPGHIRSINHAALLGRAHSDLILASNAFPMDCDYLNTILTKGENLITRLLAAKRACDRCQMPFSPDDPDNQPSSNACRHHPRRPMRMNFDMVRPCCGKSSTSPPCATGPHVFRARSLSEVALMPPIPFVWLGRPGQRQVHIKAHAITPSAGVSAESPSLLWADVTGAPFSPVGEIPLQPGEVPPERFIRFPVCYPLLAIDCEMVSTEYGVQAVRVTAVCTSDEVVYDVLVRPMVRQS